MNPHDVPIYIFIPYTLLAVTYLWLYYKNQKKQFSERNKWFSNSYIFEIIPSIFPTIGILCTALGIIIGLNGFDVENINNGIPTLITGLRLAFYSTIAGIIGLIVFQYLCAFIQKRIDDDPSRPPKQSDEISAISNLNLAIVNLQKETAQGFKNTQARFDESLDTKVKASLSSVHDELKTITTTLASMDKNLSNGFTSITKTGDNNTETLKKELTSLREANSNSATKANENTEQIISAMSKNNDLIRKKFDEFSELLKKNNTEALVEVMRAATTQFNSQMKELVEKLVQENFKELNASVQNMNDWQKENKNQISLLTSNFLKTTESFSITSQTLATVAANTERLTSDNGKLNQMIKELSKVLIEDGKFQKVTSDLLQTIATLKTTTDSFDETTNKLNSWVRTQMNFNEKAEILIKQLEDFRNLNGEVWEKYRAKMEESVNIISRASKSLSGDLDNINQQFVESLNKTLTSLDECIQRIINNKRS